MARDYEKDEEKNQKKIKKIADGSLNKHNKRILT